MSVQRLSRHYRAWIAGGAAAAAALTAPTAFAEKKDDAYFDPEALERGAKALREINKSPYAKQVESAVVSSSVAQACAIPCMQLSWYV